MVDDDLHACSVVGMLWRFKGQNLTLKKSIFWVPAHSGENMKKDIKYFSYHINSLTIEPHGLTTYDIIMYHVSLDKCTFSDESSFFLVVEFKWRHGGENFSENGTGQVSPCNMFAETLVSWNLLGSCYSTSTLFTTW